VFVVETKGSTGVAMLPATDSTQIR